MCQNPPFALSDMSALIDTNDMMDPRTSVLRVIQKLPHKLIRQKSEPTAIQKDIQR